MATRYTKDDQNHVDVFTEEDRKSFAEKHASLVQGWTAYGSFEGESLAEIISSAEKTIREAEARKDELGDISDFVAELRARITLCEEIQDGKIKGASLKW